MHGAISTLEQKKGIVSDIKTTSELLFSFFNDLLKEVNDWGWDKIQYFCIVFFPGALGRALDSQSGSKNRN